MVTPVTSGAGSRTEPPWDPFRPYYCFAARRSETPDLVGRLDDYVVFTGLRE